MPMPELIIAVGVHKPYPVTLASVISGHVVLFGYAIKESTGSAGAEVDLYNGGGTNGQLVVPIILTANQSTREYWAPEGLRMNSGLWANVASGSVVGTLFVCDCRDHWTD